MGVGEKGVHIKPVINELVQALILLKIITLLAFFMYCL